MSQKTFGFGRMCRLTFSFGFGFGRKSIVNFRPSFGFSRSLLQTSWHLDCIRNAYRISRQFSQPNATGTRHDICLQEVSYCSFLTNVMPAKSSKSRPLTPTYCRDFMSRAWFNIRWYQCCFYMVS